MEARGSDLARTPERGVGAHLVILDAVLDVDETNDLEGARQLGGPLPDDGQALLVDGLRWDHARRVARVHARLQQQQVRVVRPPTCDFSQLVLFLQPLPHHFCQHHETGSQSVSRCAVMGHASHRLTAAIAVAEPCCATDSLTASCN